MLRTLIQKKEALREKMTALWQIRDDGKSWTPEQKSEYDKHSEAVKKLNSDIKERSEFLENFNQSLPKADKAFMDLQKNKASIVKIIKRAVYQANQDSRFKVDDGPIREVAEERSKNFDSNAIISGGVPIPASHFRDRFTDKKLQKRTTITTGAGLGADLIEDTIMPEIIPNLYSKAWAGRAGCEFVENARGNYLIPAEDTKPSSGFVAEGSDYPESDIDYKNQVNLSPLKCGAIQKFTFQMLLQDETKLLQNSINSQLMKQWAQKVDDDFMNADNNPATEPKGILNYSGIQSIEGTGADGDDLTFDSLIDASGLLRANDQDMNPVWITNSKVITKAMKTLRNNVAGSLYIGDSKQIANMKYVETNIVKSNLTKGSSGAVLSQAVLIIPSSIVIVQWNMPFISLDRSNGFANDEIWVKISGYINVGLKRPKDVVNYKNIKTA